MSAAMFRKVKHRLRNLLPSSQLLRVANGMVVKSDARWKEKFEVNGISAELMFKVFDSGGKWDFLFGKTLLEKFKAVHEYAQDEITIHSTKGKTTLKNQLYVIAQQSPTTPVCIVTDEAQLEGGNQLSEVDMEMLKGNTNLFTHLTEPHKTERVQELIQLINIGDNLSMAERQKVRQLISSFADIFALSVSKVTVVEDAIHHLDIPPNTSFSLKVHQKPLTPPQRHYLYMSIDTMLEAGVIEACKPEDIKCMSATTLAQKAHQGKGLSLKELQHCKGTYLWSSLGMLSYYYVHYLYDRTVLPTPSLISL